MVNYHTPKNQMTKEQANELFVYKSGNLYWKESGSAKDAYEDAAREKEKMYQREIKNELMNGE